MLTYPYSNSRLFVGGKDQCLLPELNLNYPIGPNDVVISKKGKQKHALLASVSAGLCIKMIDVSGPSSEKM